MRKFSKILAAVLAAAVFASAGTLTAGLQPDFGINAAAAEVPADSGAGISGSCGENVTYELRPDGTLVISGSGKMYNYERTASPFYNNSNIKKAVINQGVTTVGESAFLNCSRLESVELADTITKLGWNCFYGCCALTAIDIPDSVEIIDTDSFDGCINLRDVTIPDSVTYIGEEAFYACFALTDLKIPESVNYIGRCAFRYCSSLTEIDIPEGVELLEEGTFLGCSGLERVSLPQSVRHIRNSVFADCSSLESITLPDKLESMGTNVFRGCSSLRAISVPDSVTSIGMRAFSYCPAMTEASLGNGLTEVPDKAFYGNTGLKKVTLGKNIESIGKSSFENCRSLVDIVIPVSVRVIDNCAFCGCESLGVFRIQRNVISIGEKAFADCSSLTVMNIPGSVSSIHDSAFWNCRSLKNIQVNADNSYYSSLDGVLYNKAKTKLLACGGGKTGITIPGTVKWLCKGAFYGCSRISSVDIPDSVISIAKNCFCDCTSLKDVHIGSGLTAFGNSVFQGCSSLENINIPENVTTISFGMFRDCTSLERIDIPGSVTMIDNFAFYGCSSLKEMPVPDSVNSLGNFGWYDCRSLKSITIPASVKSIGYGAFGYYYDKQTCMDTLDEDFIIYGYENTMAQKFAEESSLRFGIIDPDAALTLNRGVLFLRTGESFRLEALDAGNSTVTWATANSDIAAVSKGLVTAKSAGTVNITARAKDGRSAVCSVTVADPVIAPESITLDKSSISLTKGETAQLSAVLAPANTTQKTVIWVSGNEDIVKVKNGRITAVSAGTASVTAITENFKAAACIVTVKDPVVEARAINISRNEVYLKKGTKFQLKAVFAPADTTDQSVIWISADRSIATVSNGMITAQSPGTTTITAVSSNGLTSVCSVIVTKDIIQAKSVSLNRTEISLEKGTKFQLKAIFEPAETTDRNVTWTTSDKTIATVSNGRVTAQNPGTAVITMKNTGGLTATCIVNVSKK